MAKKTQFYYPFLDGIRALAALMVAFSHSLLIFRVDGIANIENFPIFQLHSLKSIFEKILFIPFNGSAAVILFFLISALVVDISLEKKEINLLSSFRFFIKRFFRLYPTYVATFLVSILILIFFYNQNTFSHTGEWYSKWFTFPLDNKLLIENLTLRSVNLNMNAWTLKLEFYVMIAFPILVFLKKRSGIVEDIFILAFLFLLGFYRNQHINAAYIYPFYVGMMITKWGPVLKELRIFFSRNLFIIMLAALLMPLILIKNEYIIIALETISAFYILSYLFYSGDKIIIRFLAQDKLIVLGKISYCFYLLHSFVLYMLSNMIIRHFASYINPSFALFYNLFLGIASILFTIPIAMVFNKVIEKKSIVWAKNIAQLKVRKAEILHLITHLRYNISHETS